MSDVRVFDETIRDEGCEKCGHVVTASTRRTVRWLCGQLYWACAECGHNIVSWCKDDAERKA